MALPASGSLSLKNAAGAGRSISQEVDGNETGNKSLTTLSGSASKVSPHSMREFMGYSHSLAAPGTPSSINASGTEPGGIFIEWSAPISGGAVSNYRLEVSTNGGGFVFHADKGTDTSHTDFDSLDVFTGNDYQYRIRAENTTGVSSYINSSIVNY